MVCGLIPVSGRDGMSVNKPYTLWNTLNKRILFLIKKYPPFLPYLYLLTD